MYSKTGQPHHQHHHHHHHHEQNNRATAQVPLSPEAAQANEIFDLFVAASTFKSVLHHYRNICDLLRIKPTNLRHFYPKIRNKIRSWKAQAIWNKFDKRASHKCYNHGKAAANSKVLIIGCGPCGLRTAIEAQLLGAKVVVVEKRDRFSRNNVLHLWPFVIADLKALAAKKFYGKFCAGAIDHISIRQLQCILLKVALLLGVEVFEGVSFENLVEPPDDQSERTAWSAQFNPPEHPVNQYEFDVLVGADGKRNTLTGFKRKEFRGKLAIAITANFINKHTEDDARVEEISGVAFIFNQKFFKELYAATGIDLENIVYYKDETHYFVMTAKKHSLLDKGVILNDLPDTQQLLHPSNVDRSALLGYAREAADFSTNYRLPNMEFAVNHYGKPDVAMFDFTSMFAAENACRILEKKGHKLLKCLVGDSLLEPFWPTGSGCARGFLSSFDAAWAMRSFSSGRMSCLEVISERESIYRLLAQTTPQNLGKDHQSYTLDPSSRYPTINLHSVLPFQVRNLFDTDEPAHAQEAINTQLLNDANDDIPKKRKRRDSLVHPETLLNWCKKQVVLYPDVHVENMTTSFKDGRVLCAIIHRYRPDLINFELLSPDNIEENNQLAFDIMEREFCVPPVITGSEMAECEVPDKLSMISYLSQVHDVFRGVIPHFKHPKMDAADIEELNGKKSKVSTPPVNILKNLTSSENNVNNVVANSKREGAMDSRDDGRITCRLLDEDSLSEKKSDSLKKNKKRRSDKMSLQDKYDKLQREGQDVKRSAGADSGENFSDRVRGLEAKFVGSSPHSSDKKPKDMIRAIGKIEKSDWNLAAIERKIDDRYKSEVRGDREKVPKWNKEIYEDKVNNIERRLRENGEDEATIAKYMDIDASLQRLEKKLKEGSTLETGMRGSNKVSNLASQLSSKLERKVEEKTVAVKQTARPVVPMPTSGSDLCHFCGTRVYLVERLSTEGKFFHRQCFKCDYCGASLRLGNYIYDREGRFGGKFFCIPHFGLTPKARNRRKPGDSNDSAKENIVPVPITNANNSSASRSPMQLTLNKEGEGAPTAATATSLLDTTKKTSPAIAKITKDATTTPSPGTKGVFRGTTPERVEFENSVVEQSDEEEYLSEDEWTDRNFGASANELDDTESDDNSDYSDLSDEEADNEDLPLIEGGLAFTAAETRKMAESWQRRYSTDKHLDASDESDLESDHYSEDYNAEGDESHTATEGEGDGEGVNDGYDDERESDLKAREMRRLELNINVQAPPCESETSDSSQSGSDTEIASDDESDTQIDTDSEFADDNVPKEIPMIVIDETQDAPETENIADNSVSNETSKPTVTEVKYGEKGRWTHRDKMSSSPKDDYLRQCIDINDQHSDDDDWLNDNADEKSASLTNLNEVASKPNPYTEQLKKLLSRTESTEAIAAQRNLQLRRQYLLGGPSNAPRKSVSTADLGNKFKSFMDKISETQKMLNPAPKPSPAMQVFMSTNPVTKSPILSPSAPNIAERAIAVTQGENSREDDQDLKSKKFKSETTDKSVDNLDDASSENSKSEDLGKLYSFPVSNLDKQITKQQQCLDLNKDQNNLSSSESSESNYDNLSSSHKNSFKSIEFVKETYDNVSDSVEHSSHLQRTTICDQSTGDLHRSKHYDSDEFGEKKEEEENVVKAYCDIGAVETVNQELVTVDNEATSEQLHECNLEALTVSLNTSNNVVDTTPNSRSNNTTVVSSDIDDQFEQLVTDACKGSYEDNQLLDEVLSSPLNDKEVLQSGSEAESGALHKVINDTCPVSVQAEADSNNSSYIKDNDNTSTSMCDTALEDSVTISDTKTVTPSTPPPTSNDTETRAEDSAVISGSMEDENILNSNNSQQIPRIASIESLGDTDSAISTAPSKTLSAPSKPSMLNDLENIEYMDTSESASSPEEVHNKYEYTKLEEETPTTPLAPVISNITNGSTTMKQDNNLALSDNDSSSESLCTETESCSTDTSKVPKDSHIEAVNTHVSISKDKPLPPNSLPLEGSENNSLSETQSFTDKSSYSFSGPRKESSDLYSSSKRYEGYIPRFKDRTPPFTYGRDSHDMHKSSSRQALIMPSPDEGSDQKSNPVSPNGKPSTDVISSRKISGTNKKERDGDLVAAMVMSRITRQSPDKATRRSSRTSASPLSTTSSKTSLFSSQSSQENLLEKINGADNQQENSSESSTVAKNNLINSQLSQDKKSFNNSPSSYNITESVKKSESPTKSTLPATPLTHPEQFKTVRISNDTTETFKTPYAKSARSDSTRPRAYSESISSTPKNQRNQNPDLSKSIDHNRTREMAREKAKLKSDQDLGLSPPYLAESLRVRLQQNSFSENEIDKDEKERSNRLLTAGGNVTERVRVRSKSQVVSPVSHFKSSEATAKNKEERVQELLAEHRLRDSDSQLEISAVEKEDRVRERLEEYRQKRASTCGVVTQNPTTKVRESVENKPNKPSIIRRHTHRPSLLELESMQVFSSSSNSEKLDIKKSPSGPCVFLSKDTVAKENISLSPNQQSIISPQLNKTPEQNTEKKTPKKGKDRERRRSLIQVFAGMFGKSEEKKKSQDQLDVSNMDSSPSVTSPSDTPKQQPPPRSPHTVKDKLSRLRISRSKHKNKNDKNRSSSADILGDRSSTDDLRLPLSLPTSPSHNPSPQYCSDSSNNSPPYASGHSECTSSTTLQMPSQPPKIPEESLSDEDLTSSTPKGTLERGYHNPQGSSGRKHKATIKAMKQAELKRLRMAQEIQRKLEECEVKTRELEERGVSVEKSLRGEHEGGLCKDEADLMGEWFSLVHEKNALVRWEQELLVRAKELELEDSHVRLENELRTRMTQSEHDKSREDIEREGVILADMLNIMEQKDALYTMLEEDRQRCDMILQQHPSTSYSNINNHNTYHSTDPSSHLLSASTHIPLLNDSSPSCIPCHSASRRPSFLDSYVPPSRKPSVFDKDPCSFSCNHTEQNDIARRKINVASNINSRRITLSDLNLSEHTNSNTSLLSSNLSSNLRRRRYSLDLDLPVVNNSVEYTYSQQKKTVTITNTSTLECTNTSNVADLLSTACSYAIFIVFVVWVLPFILYSMSSSSFGSVPH